MSEPTHELWSRPLYEEGDWEPLDPEKPVLAFVTVAGEVVTIRVQEKARLHDEREYQFRPRRLTPR